MTTIQDRQQATKRTIILIIGLLFLGYCMLTILPWETVAYKYDLDESWAAAVHTAFRDRIQFGKDFIYTYGPYGFIRVARYFFPATYGFGFALSVFIAIAAWAGLFRIARYCVSRKDGSVLFLLPILGFFPNMLLSMDSFQFPILILPLIIYFYVSKRMSPALVFTVINASLASLTKHTYLLLAIAFISLITIDEVGKLRRIPQVASLYLAFLALFWLVAAQDIGNIPAYIINGLEIVRGFSAAMGIGGNPIEPILYVLGTGAFLLLIGKIEWRDRRWWGSLPTLGLAAIFFITFKGAFTRHDTHALQAIFNVTPIVLIFAALLWSSINKTSWRIGKKLKLSGVLVFAFSALIFASMGSIILNNHVNYGYPTYSFKVIEHNANKLVQSFKVITGQADFQAIADQGKLYIKTKNPLPALSGTVDLYPNEIASIFANDLIYQPRPVIQSFSAYRGKLARLNAEHLKQADAPANILFDLQAIDGHLASFEDGLSWTEILTLYDITDIESRYLLLQRNDQPRKYQFEPLTEETEISFNQWFDIPDNQQPIWGKVDVHPNLLGKLVTALLRLPPLYMEIETDDGIVANYRTIGDVMKEGFLLSPTLANRWDFLDFTGTDWQNKLQQKQVKRFRIINEGFNLWLYSPSYKFSLSQLQFDRQSFEKVAGWEAMNSQIVPKPLDGGLQRIDKIDEKDQLGWMAHAPLRMLIDLDKNRQTFSFSFGILEAGVEKALEENAGDGVEFKIIALQSNDMEKTLFSRRLQPLVNPQDRGLQKGSIDLKKINTNQLIIETVAGENNMYDWSYWSELKLE